MIKFILKINKITFDKIMGRGIQSLHLKDTIDSKDSGLLIL